MTLRFLSLCALLLASMLLLACGTDENRAEPADVPGPEPAGGTTVRAVFLFNSEACQCERERNAEAERIIQEVQGMTEGLDVVPIERIDSAKNSADFDKFQRSAGITFTPALIGLDQDGNTVFKLEGYLSKAAVAEIMLGH